MAFQDPRVLKIIRFRERPGPKQDKREKRDGKLRDKEARSRALRERRNEERDDRQTA